jgi:hypothetical protein
MKDSTTKSATSQICKPLCASLKHIVDKQDNYQMKTLIVLNEYFVKSINKSGD